MCDNTMCDSPVVHSALSLSDSGLKCSNSGVGYCNSETQLDNADENRDNNSFEASSYSGKDASCGSFYICSSAYTYRFQLEQDVQQLQQQLQEETELHAILENAIEKTAVTLFSQSCLPLQILELLSSITILESTVSKLEEELISLHFQLSQERNERRLAEYHWRHSSSQPLFICSDIMKAPILYSLGCPKHPMSELRHSSEEISFQDQPSEGTSRSLCTYSATKKAEGIAVFLQEKNVSMKMDTKCCQPVDTGKLSKELQPKGLSNHPCKLSEEMVRCMKNIFISLADSTTSPRSSALESHCSSLSPRGHLSNLSTWSLSERSIFPSWVQSPKIDLLCNTEVLATKDACDPYRVCGKLSWANSGSYGLATEVSWMSVGKDQLEYAAGALRRFRTLVEQLAQVNPSHLSSDEKLAFWINLYNALIMHAYLAYGVPRSDLKLFSLMQKAAYTVGGHSFTATAIEYVILKMKPPVHRPQIALLLALHKLKVSEEQREFEIHTYEPLVAFALSCGMYSSPAIRIYTAQNIKEELQESQRDFIRASVGVSSKGRLLVPKMLHCFAKGFVDDEKLAVWISHYLPPHQAAFVEKCMSQRRQSLFGSRNCGILPFDSSFRYLFLPEKIAQ